jgi:hypothetical protein
VVVEAVWSRILVDIQAVWRQEPEADHPVPPIPWDELRACQGPYGSAPPAV